MSNASATPTIASASGTPQLGTAKSGTLKPGTAKVDTAGAAAAQSGTAGARAASGAARSGSARSGPAGAARAATPWGPATVVERLVLPQRTGDRRFSSMVELLEDARGERLVRFAYSTAGAARRGPVTLRARDVERLHEALRKKPALAEALGLDREATA
jgi:hypothetical protein